MVSTPLVPNGSARSPSRITRRAIFKSSLVDFAGFTSAIQHQPFGQHRGAVLAQFGQTLLLLATTPGAAEVAITPTVQMQHLLWSYQQGYATSMVCGRKFVVSPDIRLA